MIAWRHQVPVHSPLSAAALVEGVRAVARNGTGDGPARLTALLERRYAPAALLLTESGTAALTAALHGVVGVLGEYPGAPVALPAYSCFDVATAAEGAGARVLLYDVDPRTLAPDLDGIAAALREGAAAVVVAHLYGCPVDLSEINRLAAAAGALVIEDAAQAAGGTIRAEPAAARGSLTVLSFGRGKGLTGGGGGALLAHDARGARALQAVRARLTAPRRGWPELLALAGQFILERPSLYGFPAALPFLRLGQTMYREPRPLRAPTPVSCSVIAASWTLADRELEARRRHADRLLRALRRQAVLEEIRSPSRARPGYLRLPVLAPPAVRRSVVENGARRLGVMPGYPRVLCDLEPLSSRWENRLAVFPGSRELVARLCTLPTHSRLDRGDLARLERWIHDVGQAGR